MSQGVIIHQVQYWGLLYCLYLFNKIIDIDCVVEVTVDIGSDPFGSIEDD